MSKESIATLMIELGENARAAHAELAQTTSAQRDQALLSAAASLRESIPGILTANSIDMQRAEAKGLSAAMLDRLYLDAERIAAMADGLDVIAALPNTVGNVLAEWQQPNGLTIQRVSVPLGVIAIIYESRPNVTADAAGLCLKSGNAVILRGGSESHHSSSAIFACIRDGVVAAGIHASAVQMVSTTDREAVGYLLSSMSQWLDVVIPRGGKSLIKRVQEEARVPVIGHLEGICHVYVHAAADVAMANDIVVNAKMRRTGICGSAETLLVDQSIAAAALPKLASALQAAGCQLRGDATVCGLVSSATPATEEDWSSEYLDAVIAIKVVDDLDAAVTHIASYGSGHTEAIVTSDASAAERFLNNVDSAIVLHNASTQFADGGEFGMGAEIGIATGRIHARGPVGAEQLTSYKYIVRGNGQVRA